MVVFPLGSCGLDLQLQEFRNGLIPITSEHSFKLLRVLTSVGFVWIVE